MNLGTSETAWSESCSLLLPPASCRAEGLDWLGLAFQRCDTTCDTTSACSFRRPFGLVGLFEKDTQGKRFRGCLVEVGSSQCAPDAAE